MCVLVECADTVTTAGTRDDDDDNGQQAELIADQLEEILIV